MPDPLTIRVLAVLAGGEFCSLETLAGAAGDDLSAVRDRLDTLNTLGLALESVPGRGVRIAGGLDLLDAETVNRALSDEVRAALDDLVVLPFVDSTNAEAQRQLAMGAPCGRVYTAELQSAGRGRRGRAWVSPFARNLYLSLTWAFPGGPETLSGLSLAVGVAVVRGLADAGATGLTLKWPNDICHRDAKLGGILLETVGDVDGSCHVIIGVGLNVAMPRTVAAGIEQQWTDVSTVIGELTPDRSTLLAAVLNELLPLVGQFQADGFGAWREAWQQLDMTRDRAVVVEGTGLDRQEGIGRGVDTDGALLLDTAGGLRRFHGGEVSLRLQP